MAAKNDITGDSIISRHSEKYAENMEKIFGDKSEEKARKAKEKEEYFARLKAETEAKMNNTGTDKNEYYDVLNTEDCLLTMPGTLGGAKMTFKED